jgi:parallel beta-helix repeat protein
MQRKNVLLAVCVLSAACCAQTITVNLDGSADYTIIQSAIDAAEPNDIVIVADGTYTGDGNRDIDFLGKAITVRSATGAENCVVDCQGTELDYHRGFCFQSGEDAKSVLDGFQIINGWTTYPDYGGGIYCSGSSPTIANCIIQECRAYRGGGMCNESSSPTVTGCSFTGNSASVGGGMYNEDSGPTMTECTFTSNLAGGGGAMWNVESDTVITNCDFIDNWGGNAPGGMYNHLSNSTLIGCIFSGNKNLGMLNSSSSPTVTNCTFTGNLGGIHNSSSSPTVTNCILWGNNESGYENEIILIDHSTIDITYCNVQGGRDSIYDNDFDPNNINWGIGNIDIDPLFVDPGSWDDNGTPDDWSDDTWIEGDYHLRWTSPCINAGDPNFVFEEGEVDIDGEPRVMGGRVDMGSDEVGPKQADFTRDGRIDIDDFAVFNNSWDTTEGQTNWYVLCDLFDNGVINVSDLAIFTSDWLWIAEWY